MDILKPKKSPAKYLQQLVKSNTDAQFLSRHLPTEVCAHLVHGFGDDCEVVRQLYEYSKDEIRHGKLNLSKCPNLNPDGVIDALLLLGGDPVAVNAIRESGNPIITRMVVQLLFHFGVLILLRSIKRNDTDVRRAACTLVDCLVLNIDHPNFTPQQVYLFTYSLRALVFYKKLPSPSTVRMQQLEYLLNPLSRKLFEGYYLKGREHGTTPAFDGFYASLSEALLSKYRQLQESPERRARDTEVRARAFEILSRATQSLFGVTPYIFGSGASGLATVASDMDVVVLQTPQQMRTMAQLAVLWKNENQDDYCPFPSLHKVYKRVKSPPAPPGDGKRTKGKGNRGMRTVMMVPRPHVGSWRWLNRPLPEVAAIWASRILAKPLVKLGWKVECVETARVPILRVVAAIDRNGQPTKVPDDGEMKTAEESEKKNKVHLDPAVTVGKSRHWNGLVVDPTNVAELVHISELNKTQKLMLNKALESKLDSLINTESGHEIEIPETTVIHMDVSFNHEVVVHNTRLMKSYAECDPLAGLAGILVKHWAKRRGISDSYRGTLSGYQWMLLVIHFLQHYMINENSKIQPLLPNLQHAPHLTDRNLIVDGRHNAFFVHPSKGRNRPLKSADLMEQKLVSEVSTAVDSVHLGELSQPSEASLTATAPAKFRTPDLTKSSGSFETKEWPEEEFQFDPFLYACHTLLPIELESPSTRGPEFLKELARMREDSTPKQSLMNYTGICLSAFEVTPDLDPWLIHSSTRNIGATMADFFDFFGMKFNFHSSVVSIKRTPALPQRKLDFFEVQGLWADPAPCSDAVFEVDLTPSSPMTIERRHSTESTLTEHHTDAAIGEDLLMAFDYASFCVNGVEHEDSESEVQVTSLEESSSCLEDAVEAEESESEESSSECESDEAEESEPEVVEADFWDISLSDADDYESHKRRRARRQEIIKRDLRRSRNLQAFRQRQFICILDPLEENRTIGPANRDGFLLIVFEMLRARALLMGALDLHLQKKPVNFKKLVATLFQTAKSKDNPYVTCMPYETEFEHPMMRELTMYDREHSVTLAAIVEQIETENRKAQAKAPKQQYLPMPRIQHDASRNEQYRAVKLGARAQSRDSRNTQGSMQSKPSAPTKESTSTINSVRSPPLSKEKLLQYRKVSKPNSAKAPKPRAESADRRSQLSKKEKAQEKTQEKAQEKPREELKQEEAQKKQEPKDENVKKLNANKKESKTMFAKKSTRLADLQPQDSQTHQEATQSQPPEFNPKTPQGQPLFRKKETAKKIPRPVSTAKDTTKTTTPTRTRAASSGLTRLDGSRRASNAAVDAIRGLEPALTTTTTNGKNAQPVRSDEAQSKPDGKPPMPREVKHKQSMNGASGSERGREISSNPNQSRGRLAYVPKQRNSSTHAP